MTTERRVSKLQVRGNRAVSKNRGEDKESEPLPGMPYLPTDLEAARDRTETAALSFDVLRASKADRERSFRSNSFAQTHLGQTSTCSSSFGLLQRTYDCNKEP